MISEDAVTFREFALYFRDVLGCSEALYLDGAISSLFAPQLEARGRAREAGTDDRGGRVAGYFFFLARLKISLPS